jgi:hypothetical protein
MKLTRFVKMTAHRAAARLMLLTGFLIMGAIGAAAQDPENGRLHILKDCGTFSGIPGSSYCTIVRSNLPELPPGAQIYYDQIQAGPSAGPGYLDSNIFVYVREGQWAVGRCTVPNDNTPGICTLSDGIGPLAGFTARVNVTYKPGGDGQLYAWDGTYGFKSPDR